MPSETPRRGSTGEGKSIAGRTKRISFSFCIFLPVGEERWLMKGNHHHQRFKAPAPRLQGAHSSPVEAVTTQSASSVLSLINTILFKQKRPQQKPQIFILNSHLKSIRIWWWIGWWNIEIQIAEQTRLAAVEHRACLLKKNTDKLFYRCWWTPGRRR